MTWYAAAEGHETTAHASEADALAAVEALAHPLAVVWEVEEGL